jgi:hypothetical protein
VNRAKALIDADQLDRRRDGTGLTHHAAPKASTPSL